MRNLFAVLGVLIVALAGILFFKPFDKKQRPVPVTAQATPDPTPAVKSESATLPSFDLVQVSSDGLAVIAGQAVPESSVEVMDGTVTIGQANADATGSWVMNPLKPLAAGNRTLRLKMTERGKGKTVEADKTIVVLVPDRGNGNPATVAMIDGKTGATRIMQRAANFDGLAIDLLEQPVGKPPVLRGQANKPGKVLLYAADKLVGEATPDANGQWSITLPAQSAPDARADIRADLVGQDNKVIARAVVNVAEMLAQSGDSRPTDQATIVVIRPGNNLWRIASQTYGDGFQYRLIFEANKNQIADPDLIYPGQVFSLPSSKGSSKPIENAEKREPN